MAEIADQSNLNDHDNDPTIMIMIMPKIITALASLLQRISEYNDLSPWYHHHQPISVFHSLTIPTVSVQGYLERIFNYANCSHSCYIVAYIYQDRLVQRQPYLTINSFTVHRLLITSILVSVKFMDDMHYNNAYYAKVGGISTEEMNFLEADFLFSLGFQLIVTPSTFNTYCSYLERELPMHSLGLEPSLAIRSCSYSEEESSSHQKKQLTSYSLIPEEQLVRFESGFFF